MAVLKYFLQLQSKSLGKMLKISKIVFFVLLLGLTKCEYPNLYCEYESRSSCHISYVYIAPSVMQYQIKTIQIAPMEVERIHVTNSLLSVLTSAFCETYVELNGLIMPKQNIEEIRPDAFQNCKKLNLIVLSENSIKVLPEKIFHQTVKLENVYLDKNKIEKIPNQLFEANSDSLVQLDLNSNKLKSFPVRVVENCKKLVYLGLGMNSLYDLDAEQIISKVPSLSIIQLNHNLFMCHRHEQILKIFKNAKIVVDEYSGLPIKRNFKMCPASINDECVGTC